MATLQTIRSKGPLLVIVIGLALFAFIAGDAWKVLQPHQGKQDVGEVYGKSLSAQDFQKMVDEYSQVIKMTQGLNSLNDDQLTQIKDQVWQTYVSNQLIAKEAEELGLTVSNAEMQDVINRGSHPLLMQTPFRNQQTGAFDKDMLKKFLVDYANMDASKMPAQYVEYYQNLGTFWKFIEKTIKQSLLTEKYQALLSKSLISNPIQANDAFKSRTEMADVNLAVVPYSSINDSTVKVSDSEIKELYNKKKQSFEQLVETRNIKYIDVEVKPSQKDRQEVLAEVTGYANQLKGTEDITNFIHTTGSVVPFKSLAINKNILPQDVSSRLDSVNVGEVYGPYYNQGDNSYNAFKVIAKESLPDSIQFRQIQVYVESEEKSKNTADSIMNALNSGADFATIAKKYGQTGESTWVSAQSFENANLDVDNLKFVKTLLSATPNKLNKIKIGQAYIITEVMNKKAFQNKYNVAVIKRPIEFSKETYNKTYNNFSKFVAQNTTKEQVLANAEKNGYRVLERNDVSSAEHYIGDVKNTREAMKWLFDADINEVSPLYECGENNHLMLVIVEKINEKGYRDINSVADMLRAEIIRDKKADIISAKMKGLSFDKIKSLPNSLNEEVKRISFAAPTFVSITRASEPVLGAYTSKTAVNKMTAPIKGNAGVYVMQVLHKEKSAEKFDKKNEETTVESTNSRYAAAFMNDLYKRAKVKDTRYLFF